MYDFGPFTHESAREQTSDIIQHPLLSLFGTGAKEGQLTHVSAPTVTETKARGHIVHIILWSVVSEYIPTGQSSQLCAEAFASMVPGRHPPTVHSAD